jgi:hypothetical protein
VLGNPDYESARVFLCGNNGGNVHFDFTRGASDLTSFDLSSCAGALPSIDGSTSITKIGSGSLDQLGDNKGSILMPFTGTRNLRHADGQAWADWFYGVAKKGASRIGDPRRRGLTT